MPQCCFAGCHNRTDDGKGLSFFRFPRRDPNRSKAWISACGRVSFSPSQHSRVCSQHFHPADFECDIRTEFNRRLRLKDSAVPANHDAVPDGDRGPPNSVSRQRSRSVAGVGGQASWHRRSRAKRGHAANGHHQLARNSKDKRRYESNITELNEPINKRQMDDDVILLSDDEDDKYLDELYLDLQNGGFNDENIEKAAALFRKLENDLMNEETNLLLLENWRDNQKLNNVQLKSGKVISCPNPTPKVSSNNNVPASTPNSTVNNSSKYTKFMALQALEQQLLVKKSTLRKQLERSLDKITLPKPPPGNGLSDVAFVPSTVTNEFTALLGLDEIVHSIQTFELNGDKSSEQGRIFSPFACSKCKTDFTPVWKRKRPGSSEVVCESCIIESQRSGIHKTYYNQVSASLKQYASAEHEAEREYQDVVNNPVKLDAFTKEQERKLAANNPTPANQQQTQAIQQQSLVVNAQNQRYQTNYQQQAMHTANHRQAQTTTVNSAGASHLTNANVRRQPVPPTAPVVSSQPSQPQQQQLSLATQIAMQQLAAQYQQQQLSKNLASNSSNANLLLSANPLLSSGLAQHQLASMLAAQQQQQQRLSSVQQQQPSITDQLTQLQNLLLMISAANNNNQAASGANSNHAQNNSSSTGSGQQRTANNQPTNNSTLNQLFVNYSLYLQQQQQQQQAAAAAAAAAQAQQQQQASLALLQQLIGASGMANNSSSTTNVSTANNSNNNNNNTNLASYLALLQNVWATQSSQSNKK